MTSGLPTTIWKLHGKYYNLEPWMPNHPGGDSIIKACVNTDATIFMDSYHAVLGERTVKKILEMMKKYEVTVTDEQAALMEIPDENSPHHPLMRSTKEVEYPAPTTSDDDFYRELTRRVRCMLKLPSYDPELEPIYHGDALAKFGKKVEIPDIGEAGHTKANTIVCVYYAAIFALFWSLYHAFAYQGSFIAALVGGTCVFMFGLGGLHDGTHRCLSTKHKWVNNSVALILGSAHDFISVWYHTHVREHHVYTNLDDWDPDGHIRTNTSDIFNKKRVTKRLAPILGENLAETFLNAILMAAVSFKACCSATVYYISNPKFCFNNDPVYTIFFRTARVNFLVWPKTYQYLTVFPVGTLLEFGCRLFYFYVLAVHPILVAPSIWIGLRQIAALHAISSFQHYVTTMPVHDNHKCRPREEFKPGEDWAKWQITHACSTSPFSQPVNFWSSGTACQVAHHLYPGVHWYWYPAITRLIEDLCIERNVTHHRFQSVNALWWSHVDETLCR